MIALTGTRIRVRAALAPARSLVARLREADSELLRLQADAIAGYERTTADLVRRSRAAEQRATEAEASLAVAQMQARLAADIIPTDRQLRIAEFTRALADAEDVDNPQHDPLEVLVALRRVVEPARYLILEHPK